MQVANLLKRLIGVRPHADRFGTTGIAGKQHERCNVHSFAASRQRAVSDQSRIRLLAEEVAAERSRTADGDTQDKVRLESRCLIAAAKRAGCYIDASIQFGQRISKRTGESEVYWHPEDKTYVKVKNPFAKLHLKNHDASAVLFEHVVHNVVFPEARLEFAGVTEQMGEARLVFRQAAVCADHLPTDQLIADRLADLGFQPEGRYGFGNEWILITDVMASSDNVLLGDDGKLYFIDPIIGFKHPPEETIAGLLQA